MFVFYASEKLFYASEKLCCGEVMGDLCEGLKFLPY